MMYKHYILITQQDPNTKPIAFHQVIQNKQDFDAIRNHIKILDNLKTEIAAHIIHTEKPSIKSLKDKDHAFKNFEYLEDFSAFLNRISVI